MCYTVSQYTNEDFRDFLIRRYRHKLLTRLKKKGQTYLPLPPIKPRRFINGYSHSAMPVVLADDIYMLEWGLIPVWVKDSGHAKEMQNMTLNAVGETVFEKPSFRNSIVNQRCLVPVTGFYEWRDLKTVKYPYYIQEKNNEIFSLGGIYESWTDRDTGEVRNTFSILTTPANPLMEKIHNLKKRMPLIIPEDKEMEWIDPDLSKAQITELIKPYPETEMKAYTISRLANNARADREVEEILDPVEYPELILADQLN